MKQGVYDEIMGRIMSGDLEYWDDALRHAKRSGLRRDQMRLLRQPEWSEEALGQVPDDIEPLYLNGVELCWNHSIAVLFAADCAERVGHIFADAFSADDSMWIAIEAARAWARDPTPEHAEAAASAASEAGEAASWASDMSEEAGEGAEAEIYLLASYAADAAATVADSAALEDSVHIARDVDWVMRMAVYAVGDAEWGQEPGGDQATWQRERLTQYLLGEVIPCWSES